MIILSTRRINQYLEWNIKILTLHVHICVISNENRSIEWRKIFFKSDATTERCIRSVPKVDRLKSDQAGKAGHGRRRRKGRRTRILKITFPAISVTQIAPTRRLLARNPSARLFYIFSDILSFPRFKRNLSLFLRWEITGKRSSWIPILKKKKKRRYIYEWNFCSVVVRIFKNYLASNDCKSYDNYKILYQTILKFPKKFFPCESFHNEFIFGHFERTKSLSIFELLTFVSFKSLSLIIDIRVIWTRIERIDSNPISLKSPF